MWTGDTDTIKSTKELPPVQSVDWVDAKYFGHGYLASGSRERNDLTFLHVPPIASEKPVEGWSIPSFTYKVFDYAAYPPENLLAVVERGER